jgi:hypothetical protein
MRRYRQRVGWALAASILIAIGSPSAHADAAAGRRAYDKGEYRRAMVEWQTAADHGDPDAEFGLGNLYEFGAGDLAQDYSRAAYWYRKSAGHGNTEAEYRLALITAAGGDDFPGNLTEAYKWASLAAKSEGVWGSLALAFEKQLDQVTSSGQRANGERLAAAWTNVRTARPAQPGANEEPSTVVSPVTQPSAEIGKGKAMGCPGWPFPTLPCTEQFPALATTLGPPPPVQPEQASPIVSAPTEPESALNRLDQALARIDCAALRGGISADGAAVISGTVADAADRALLGSLAARFFPAAHPQLSVEIVPPPLCRSLAEFNTMRLADPAAADRLRLSLEDGGARLREGDAIRIAVRVPAYPVYLRLDYFALDGRVLHLSPGSGEPPQKIAAGATHLFGNPANGEDWRAGGAPFGTEFIAATATAQPLPLGSRPRVELAADYLRALRRALDRVNSAASPNRVATLLVRTSAR